jgi:anthranilate phosphoribosyltransferase
VDPEELGIRRATHEDLAGGDADASARIARGVLAGDPGPARDIVVLNAAAALEVAGLAPDLRGGLELAAASIDEGRAAAALERWIAVSNA